MVTTSRPVFQLFSKQYSQALSSNFYNKNNQKTKKVNKNKTSSTATIYIVRVRLYVCDDQSQNKLIRITILLHESTSRGKETRVVDTLRLKHIISIFLSVTAHYKVVSTIGKTNTIAVPYLQDCSI